MVRLPAMVCPLAMVCPSASGLGRQRVRELPVTTPRTDPVHSVPKQCAQGAPLRNACVSWSQSPAPCWYSDGRAPFGPADSAFACFQGSAPRVSGGQKRPESRLPAVWRPPGADLWLLPHAGWRTTVVLMHRTHHDRACRRTLCAVLRHGPCGRFPIHSFFPLNPCHARSTGPEAFSHERTGLACPGFAAWLGHRIRH